MITQTISRIAVSIDSLYLRLGSINSVPSKFLQENYLAWRSHKQDFDYSQPIDFYQDFPGLGKFKLLPIGHRPYEFVFTNPEIGDIRIWNPAKWHSGKNTGQIYLDFRSKFLCSQGLLITDALAFVDATHKLFFASSQESNWCRVSRADLCTDISGKSLNWNDVSQFVTRARLIDAFVEDANMAELLATYKEWLNTPQSVTRGAQTTNGHKPDDSISIPAKFAKLLELGANTAEEPSLSRVISRNREPQTIYIGRFASEIYARIYDKLASLPAQHKEYMREIWQANGWDGESPVLRVEFSLSGDFLKGANSFFDDQGNSLDLRLIENFLPALPSLWGYLCSNWVRHCEPNGNDEERWRWQNTEFWNVVRDAIAFDEVAFRHHGRSSVDHEQLKMQALGCILSWSVLEYAKSRKLTILDQINGYFASDRFIDDFKERQAEYGLDGFTDTCLSANFRSMRMAEGFGS